MQEMMSNLKKASNKDVSTYPGVLTESFNGKESVNDITTSFINLVYVISRLKLFWFASFISLDNAYFYLENAWSYLRTLALVGFRRLHVYIVELYLDSSFLGP